MMTEVLLALFLPPLLLAGWALLQFAWRRQMAVDGDDVDALAIRGGGCGSCNCTSRCKRNNPEGE